MDEVYELCVRVLGSGAAASEAAAAAREAGDHDRIAQLGAAVAACRERASEPRAREGAGPDESEADEPRADDGGAGPGESAAGSLGAGEAGGGLAVAVAHELEQATSSLPERQREALALRELLRLPYAEIAAVTGATPEAVGSLLAEARVGLRDARRGPLPQPSSETCLERDRSWRLLAARQDGEAVSDEDEEWLHAHLMSCEECEMAHSAMLEASLCYRGWRSR